ncbi:MAG: class I SAM-dependent methyltransferase, partial [Pirellulales bacterium]
RGVAGRVKKAVSDITGDEDDDEDDHKANGNGKADDKSKDGEKDDKDKDDKDKADKEKADKEKADKEKADKEKADKEKADKKKDDKKKDDKPAEAKPIWTVKADASGDLIKAGKRLYAGGKNLVTVIEEADDGKSAKIAAKIPIDGQVERLIAADDRLFAVTLDGKILALGDAGKSAPAAPNGPKSATPPAVRSELAERVLADCGVVEGYAVVYGAGDGHAILALAQAMPKLQIVVVDANAERVNRLRTRCDAIGLVDGKAALLVADPLTAELPPYVSSLSVVVEPAAPSVHESQMRTVFHSLRAYGGKPWLPAMGADQAKIATLVAKAQLPGAKVHRLPSAVIVERAGP